MRNSALTLLLLIVWSSAVYAAEAPRAERLRVVSYNVWGLPVPLTIRPERFDLIARVTPELDADVIVFQETFSSLTNKLAKLSGYPYAAFAPSLDPLRFTSGLLVVSRYPIVGTKLQTYSSCAGVDCFAAKGAYLVRIKIPKIGEIDIVDTHLNAGGVDRIRAAQIAQMAKFVGKYSSAERPLIVAGDMNTRPGTSNYWTMIRTMSLVDAHAEFVRTQNGLSDVVRRGYTSDPRRNPNTGGRAEGKRIDFVFGRNSREWAMRPVDSKLVFDSAHGGLFLSDHFGVMVDYEFTPRATRSIY